MCCRRTNPWLGLPIRKDADLFIMNYVPTYKHQFFFFTTFHPYNIYLGDTYNHDNDANKNVIMTSPATDIFVKTRTGNKIFVKLKAHEVIII